MMDYQINTVVNKMLEEGLDLREAQRAFRRAWVRQALKRNGNNQCAAAAMAGVHRNTIGRSIKELGVPMAQGKKMVRHSAPIQADVVPACAEQKTA